MWAAGSSGRHALVSKQLCSQGGVTAGHSGITLFGKQERGGRAVGSEREGGGLPYPAHKALH